MATAPAPMRAAAFLDTLGVVTHLTDPAYADPVAVDRLLDYTGISHVRLNAPYNAKGEAELVSLARNGAKIDLIINGYGPVQLESTMTMLRGHLPNIRAIEMPNEIDIFPITYKGLGGIEAAMRFQQDVYTAIRADHAFDNIPVYGFSLGATQLSAYPSLRDMSAYGDYANVHAYAPNGIRPAWVLPPAIEGWRKLAPSDPVVVTETGYYTSPGHTGWGGVTENVQAQYLLDTAFGNASRGVARTYFYDLINDGPDLHERENNFGFFRFDHSAKPVATAFHNLTAILADNGPAATSFSTHAVAYGVTGLPFTASSMMLEKSDGTHMLAVWNEEDLWNESTGTEIASRHYAGTVTLDRVYDTVLVFDPMLGDKPVATYRNVSSVKLDVASHPLIVQFGAPVAAVEQVVVSKPVEAVPSSGTDKLVVKLSEEAWQGHAQYTLKVDGVQHGGVRTASASHAEGRSEEVVLTGDWGAGPHTVTVDFLNDAFRPGVGDRNLFVDGILFNGKTVPGAGATLFGGGPRDFAVGERQLTVRVSEEAWRGDAQFVVKVDGVPVGGTNTVTAQRSAGKAQDFTFVGSWDQGRHDVSVDFINDLFTPGQGDRNLFVEGIAVDGVAQAGTGAVLYGPGPAHFDVLMGA